MTFAQAVKRLKCEPASLQAWAELGVIPSTRAPDGSPRFDERHVEALALDGSEDFESLFPSDI